jgi:ATP-dependent exoDNAse (exonuclease V) beta subunit
MPKEPWQTLIVKNSHERDRYIHFDEPTHTYTIKGTHEGYISVTKLIHYFFPEFDADEIIRKMKNGAKWTSSPYYGRTDEDIKNEWKENGRASSEAGTKMHLAIEQYLNGAFDIIDTEVKESVEWKYFTSFWKKFGTDLEPYRMEWEVWVEELRLAGSIDAVFRKKSDGTFVIYDWKRSKEIKTTNNFETAHYPLNHLPNTNYWHYTLQLNIYRWILETHYGMKISGLYLIILHPNNKSFIRMELNILTDEIQDMIACRQRALENKSVYIKSPVILPAEPDE